MKKSSAKSVSSNAPLSKNRKASFDVAVEKTFEAGLQLSGDEIKSVRAGRLQLNGAYVKLMGKGRDSLPRAVLVGMHLSSAVQPERTRQLLLHKNEILEIQKLLEAKGQAVVPLDVHLVRGWAKVKIGVGKGRKAVDKRHLLKDRDVARETASSVGKIR